MGRPKLDYSKCICNICEKTGIQLSKGMCRTCYQKEFHRNKHDENPQYRAKKLAYSTKWNNINRDKVKANHLKSHLKPYSMDAELYWRKLANQKFVCVICGKDDPRQRLSVDHNHTTGQVRGLVCTTCNFSIALVENNDPKIIEKIQDYLRIYKEIAEKRSRGESMMRRLGICQEPAAKGAIPCASEAKSFCTDCLLCICNNHSGSHETITCEYLKIVNQESVIVEESVPVEPPKEEKDHE